MTQPFSLAVAGLICTLALWGCTPHRPRTINAQLSPDPSVPRPDHGAVTDAGARPGGVAAAPLAGSIPQGAELSVVSNEKSATNRPTPSTQQSTPSGGAPPKKAQVVHRKKAQHAVPSKGVTETIRKLPGTSSVRDHGDEVWVDVKLTSLGSPQDEKAQAVATNIADLYADGEHRSVCVHVTAQFFKKLLARDCRVREITY
jgi:hypothetical protein